MTTGPEEIALAIAALRRGALVAFPTETVYGLGADAFDARAVEHVFRLKGRPANNPLIVHVSDVPMARRVVSTWPDAADRLAAEFWPGPLSIVLPKSPDLPAIVTAGGPNVAVRCPDHPTTLALLAVFGSPLVGPSANRSGLISPTRAEHVYDAFPPDEVFVLDGGPCERGIESTVVRVPTPQNPGPVTVLRLGLISPKDIERVIGEPVIVADATARADDPAALPSPGTLDRHYAPAAPAARFEPSQWPELLDRLKRERLVVVLALSDRRAPPPHVTVPMPVDPREYASRLYAELRAADDLRPGLIAVESPHALRHTDDEPWRAIADRLRRATVPLASA